MIRSRGDAGSTWQMQQQSCHLQMPRMSCLVPLLWALCCLLLMPAFLEASSLVRGRNPAVSIESAKAHHFLANSRPKRNIDPKWYRGTPDFQFYYRFYNNIGHIEGLYEIDRIRILYQQMRHLELTYGPDASAYQNVLGVQSSTAAPTPDPLEHAQKIYLCQPKDPLCKPQIVYIPAGAVPVLCDPRHKPGCGEPKTEESTKAIAPSERPTKKSIITLPPPISVKHIEYDCDPYWDPDCLVDHPRRPAQDPTKTKEPGKEEVIRVEAEESVPAEVAQEKSNDPYDFKRDLFDPFLYGNPAPNQE